MEIVEKHHQGICILELSGQLDSNTAKKFENKIFEVVEKGLVNYILDLKDLEYISSAGLRVIFFAAKKIKKQNGRIVLCAMKDFVWRIFDYTGLDSIISVTPSVEDALKKFKIAKEPSRF